MVVSDTSGKAHFEVTSDVSDQYDLTATINGVALGKKIVVTFR